MRFALRSGRRGRLPEDRRVVAEEDRDAVEPRSDPDELAGRAELVELLGPVIANPSRQHLGLPQRNRESEALERY